ncbi:MAG: hypothetical protein ACK2TX_06710, partial [Anaerolineales bacterium]
MTLQTHICIRFGRVREEQRLAELLPDSPSARAAVDMALFDIIGKACDLPVWKLLGGYRDNFRTSVTVGVMSLAETV